jgi:thioredoxin 2
VPSQQPPPQKCQPVCGRCKSPLTFNHPLKVTDANYASAIERSPLPVLLDLWAPWCGPCRMLAPVIEELASELSGRLRVAKLNVDENPLVSSRFGVRSIPTLLVLKEGREVDRLVGAQSKAEILRRLQALI